MLNFLLFIEALHCKITCSIHSSCSIYVERTIFFYIFKSPTCSSNFFKGMRWGTTSYIAVFILQIFWGKARTNGWNWNSPLKTSWSYILTIEKEDEQEISSLIHIHSSNFPNGADNYANQVTWIMNWFWLLSYSCTSFLSLIRCASFHGSTIPVF